MNRGQFILKPDLDLENYQRSVLTEKVIVDYVLEKFEIFKKKATKNKFVIFHTNNKFLLMCHNQDKLRVMGNIVANHQKKRLPDCIKEYEMLLKDILSFPPTTKRHINTLMHIAGHFSNDMSEVERLSLVDILDQLRDEKITIGVALWKIESLIYKYNKTYLATQTYFSLYAEKRPWNVFFS